MNCTPDENDPFSFEGPEIYKCKVSIFHLQFNLNFRLCEMLVFQKEICTDVANETKTFPQVFPYTQTTIFP